MTKSLCGASLPTILIAALLAPGGRGLGPNQARAGEPPRGVAEAQAPPVLLAQRGRTSPGRGAVGGAEATPPIKEIMVKLTKGQNSLTSVIGQELGAGQPPWETIQPQVQEYVRLAAALGRNQPPRGSKESWASLTAAFAESATALDRAAASRTYSCT
jgi:hypothetical protein